LVKEKGAAQGEQQHGGEAAASVAGRFLVAGVDQRLTMRGSSWLLRNQAGQLFAPAKPVNSSTVRRISAASKGILANTKLCARCSSSGQR
jgi:hypothetical protein